MAEIPPGLRQIQKRITEIEQRIQRYTAPVSNSDSFQNAVTRAAADLASPSSSGTRGTADLAAFDDLIEKAASQNDLPPALLKAVCQVESGGNPAAVSPHGAQGLMQLMPGTAADLGVTDPFDAEQNLFGGARYLRTQLDAFGGDVRKALAAYNAGPAAVTRYQGVPPYPETQQYVQKVLSQAASFE